MFLGGEDATNAITTSDFDERDRAIKQMNDCNRSPNRTECYTRYLKTYGEGTFLGASLARVRSVGKLKGMLCEGGKLDLRVCNLGASENGQKLKKQLEEFLGVEITIYNCQISPGWITDYVLEDGTTLKKLTDK